MRKDNQNFRITLIISGIFLPQDRIWQFEKSRKNSHTSFNAFAFCNSCAVLWAFSLMFSRWR